jgi:hypothetical protein
VDCSDSSSSSLTYRDYITLSSSFLYKEAEGSEEIEESTRGEESKESEEFASQMLWILRCVENKKHKT